MTSVILSKPYAYIWLSIPIIALIILLRPSDTFDLPLHDTFYVLSSNTLAIGSSLILVVFGLIYYLLKNYKLAPWLSSIQVVLLIGSLLGFILMSTIPLKSIGNNYQLYARINLIRWTFVFAFVLSTLIFIINLVQALIKMKKRRTH